MYFHHLDCSEQGIAYCCNYEITNLATDTVLLCQIECQQNDLCSHWSYISQICYLKSAKGTSMSFDSAISGPKFCAESSSTSDTIGTSSLASTSTTISPGKLINRYNLHT